MTEEPKELTLFEKIANHTIPSDIVYEDDQVSVAVSAHSIVLCVQRYQSVCSCSYHCCSEGV